jgi:hypothetical protein
MIPETRSSRYRLAVLIDADNASHRIADGLFEEVAKLGEASVRRIYGDFSGPRLKLWADILSKHAIIPQQNFAYTQGKNASDIALVIDAMDLLHSGRFDGFCLVSSDSDFTRLAARIREQGIDVYGFGEQKTPESFRQACRRFIFTENLLPEPSVPNQPRSAGRKALQPSSAAHLWPCQAERPRAEDRRLRRRADGGPGRAHPPQAGPEGEARPAVRGAGEAPASLRLFHPQKTMTLRSAAPLVTPSIAWLIFSSGKRPETSSSSFRRFCR